MPFQYLNRIIFQKEATLKEVLERFNETAIHTENSGFGIITDKDGRCIGVVSDGDIRRKLIEDISIDVSIKVAMNKEFSFVTKEDNSHKILRQFDNKVVNLPVLDNNGIPVDLYQYSNFVASSRSEQRIIRARVPVRMSYSGGGTDMSSFINDTPAAVLSSTINKYCTASIIVRDDKEIHITSKDLDLKYFSKNIHEIEYGDNLDLIKAAVKIMQPDFGFDLETFAEFEPGTGLGGSSAVVVSVLGALNYFRNEQQLDIYQLSDLAYQVERIDMKLKGGWQDQYATTFGGFSWIEFRKSEVIVSPLLLQRNTILELEYNLMLFRLGGSRSSSEIQKSNISDIDKNSVKQKSFKEMIQLAVEMKESLLKGNVKHFADLLHKSWMLKIKMNNGVTNEFVEDCYNAAKELGALGGKLLGAGGSGYLLIYASPLYQKKIKSTLAKKGAIQEMFKFGKNGLEVWSTKR
ncbi:MAG: CBS domain-containing protein [Candidatus Marinimicrobia bacterium]|jgi:D-glycero-alpha-D-manno-heptose-7-phosphate kinase|nr:CBS domain-containing protein [Candidatus Neomarinimicrobiota bacterium]